MLDEKKEDIKLRIWQKTSHRHHMPLIRAKRVENEEKDFYRRILNEPLLLTEEEKEFDKAWQVELNESIRLSEEEWEKWKQNKPSKWWYTHAKIDIKKDIHEMKENYRLALTAQEEVCNALEVKAEKEEKEEWFTSLTPENRVKARVALREQRRLLMKLQNQMLEVWEEELVKLHSSMKDFPSMD